MISIHTIFTAVLPITNNANTDSGLHKQATFDSSVCSGWTEVTGISPRSGRVAE